MLVLVLVFASMGCWIAACLLGLVAASDRAPMGLGLLGSVLALAGAVVVLAGGAPSAFVFRFWGVAATLQVDALSAAFLVPLHIVGGLGVLYGRGYWPLDAAKHTGRWVRLAFGMLVVAMTLVFIARQGVLFLVAWEAMAMAALLLMATEHERPEVLKGTWVYLVCTHTGTVFLTLMVILLAQRLGGYGWTAHLATPEPWRDGLILVLALVGFGFKAGLVPLHFWLPAAHAGTPSHGSALLSAVMLKAGVYGVLRISGLLPPVPHLGTVVLAIGGLTALYGVGCALAQRDYKRLLAYSSVENLGIIFMGIGLGWMGRATNNPWLTALGYGGAVYHVWNHAAFKSLLFFGAGSMLHATGTRDLEKLGGLAARMPRTTLALLPGVLAVAALPPFNGFVSEWFLYRGFFASFMGGNGWWMGGLALTALALTGGLAGVAFAKFFGFAFLGEPRAEEASHAHDPGSWMEAPMAVLAGLCLALSLGGALLLPVLDRVTAAAVPGANPLLEVALGHELLILAALAALVIATGAAARSWLGARRKAEPAPGTWDCGYAAPTVRMQYTASSFADGWSVSMPGLRTRIRRIKALFPHAVAFQSEFQDAVGEGFAAPRTERAAARLLRFRSLQQGQLPVYLLYVLLTLVAAFLWVILRPWVLG